MVKMSVNSQNQIRPLRNSTQPIGMSGEQPERINLRTYRVSVGAKYPVQLQLQSVSAVLTNTLLREPPKLSVRGRRRAQNARHQRMSVTLVAPPRNHFHYNSFTVPV